MAGNTVDQIQYLRDGAPRQSANVRALARFAATSACPTARLGFAARVDLDRLLVGTRYEAPFGQSPFAFRRGNRFEEGLRRDGHKPILALLHEGLGYSTTSAIVSNLRDGRPTVAKLEARATATSNLVRSILAGAKKAPNLIDGAVLGREIGGIRSFFEADAVAANFDLPIHAGEVKSFPTVDGQADPEKLGAAIAQVAIYILLLRELVDRLGGDPDRVSTHALIITPRNTGLQPTMTVKSVGREVDRAKRILDSVPRAEDVVADVPTGTPTFGSMLPGRGRSDTERVDNAMCLVDAVGNSYQPGCLSTCGFSKLCRERAHRRGDLVRFGGQFGRTLPGVNTIDRIGELAGGATPTTAEESAALRLQQAHTLVNEFARPSAPKKRRKRS